MSQTVFKKEIDISNKPKLSLLKFRKNRKLPWFSASRPDLATDFNSFEINILNGSQTIREIIIDLKKQKNVKSTIDFLTSNCDLTYEKYNPRVKSRSRRRK